MVMINEVFDVDEKGVRKRKLWGYSWKIMIEVVSESMLFSREKIIFLLTF